METFLLLQSDLRWEAEASPSQSPLAFCYMDCNPPEPKDQQGHNLPVFTDSKFLVRKHVENQWLHRCSRPHIQMFHTSAPGEKVVEFPVLNCAALCPQTDGSSFAEKDSQSRLCLHITSLTLRLGYTVFYNSNSAERGNTWRLWFLYARTAQN